MCFCKRILEPGLTNITVFLACPYNIKVHVLMIFNDEVFGFLPCHFIYLFFGWGRGFFKTANFDRYFKFSVDYCLVLFSLVGVIICFFPFHKFRNCNSLILYCYLSKNFFSIQDFHSNGRNHSVCLCIFRGHIKPVIKKPNMDMYLSC